MPDYVEPLLPDLWFQRIEMIANGELGSTENGLRHALHMLQLTPQEFRPRWRPTIDEDRYEALLEAGNLDAAALSLVAAPTLTVQTTSGEGSIEVALGCRTLNATIIGKGDSVAAAILQAWTKSLLMLRAESTLSLLKEANGP